MQKSEKDSITITIKLSIEVTTIADIIIKLLMNNVKVRNNFPITLVRKYVDNLLLALPEDRVLDELHIFRSIIQTFSLHLQQSTKYKR